MVGCNSQYSAPARRYWSSGFSTGTAQDEMRNWAGLSLPPHTTSVSDNVHTFSQ